MATELKPRSSIRRIESSQAPTGSRSRGIGAMNRNGRVTPGPTCVASGRDARRWRGCGESQVRPELPAGEQRANVGDALVSRALELIERQADRPVGLEQLDGPLACCPAELEPESVRHLVGPDPIVARIGRGAGSELDLAIWHD